MAVLDPLGSYVSHKNTKKPINQILPCVQSSYPVLRLMSGNNTPYNNANLPLKIDRSTPLCRLVNKDGVKYFFNLIPPTPFSSLEKGEKTIMRVGLSPLARLERGFRGEVNGKIASYINCNEQAFKASS